MKIMAARFIHLWPIIEALEWAEIGSALISMVKGCIASPRHKDIAM